MLTVDVLRDGWVKVPIPAGLMVRDARLDGQPVPLIEGPPAHVVLSRAGRVVLALEISLPLAASAGSRIDRAAVVAAPVSRATLALPKSGVDLTVAGGFIGERSESATESRWTAFGRANQPLAFSWKRKVDDRRAELPLRFRARVSSSSASAKTCRQIVGGGARRSAARPRARSHARDSARLVVNQVNGATVADWEVGDGLLRVRLLDPVATEMSFVVAGRNAASARRRRERAARARAGRGARDRRRRGRRARRRRDRRHADARARARRHRPSSATRRRPRIAVDGRVSAAAARRHRSAIARRHRSCATRRKRSSIANVEEARYRALAAEDGRLLVEARYAVRNNQRSFLKVTLPPGATIWSASVAGRPMRPGVAEGEAVLLPLEKGRAGEDAPTFVVAITYLQPIEAWIDKGTRATRTAGARSSGFAHRRRAVSLAAFRVALQPGASASRAIRACSPKRCARAARRRPPRGQRRRHRPPPARRAAGTDRRDGAGQLPASTQFRC